MPQQSGGDKKHLYNSGYAPEFTITSNNKKAAKLAAGGTSTFGKFRRSSFTPLTRPAANKSCFTSLHIK
jgi:hypothetical protein